jgi:tetratricopeptide (TPR) repeat protein
MISSTALDLPEHRGEIMDACLRQGMFPMMMEHLPASGAEAISSSLRLVDEANIYIGVFAHRYGYVPKEKNPERLSITEMEYNRAVKRKIPRLIFVMDKSHLITIDYVELGEGANKLKAFKDRLQTENSVNFFKSPEDLRAHAINSLSYHRQPDLATFHYIREIPAPPEAYIAHPYTLLQTHRLVGRQAELSLLTDWVTGNQEPIYKAHILNIVAIGGLGKSALTWTWFNDIAPQEMKPLAGRMWWSFYESDATFENFVTRALAYVTGQELEEVRQIPASERETRLLATLDREPFLIVLDGLERLLIAYARMDVAHAYDLPTSASQSLTSEYRLRKTADPRAGAFLRKLSGMRAARILVSTRLYPADLQKETGEPMPGSDVSFLPRLTEDDALKLWRAFGVTGARDSLLSLFKRAGNHPLLIQALASEVAQYRRAPGDFEQWRLDHPDFDPFKLPHDNVTSHVLEFALRGLDDKARQALRVIAAFRMPARYDTLAALLIGEGKACTAEHELDEVLTELENRGLLGWDKRANRYDLHPIVRGVIWNGLNDDTKRGIYETLHAHFEPIPALEYSQINSLEDLTPAIELYNTLIGLGRYDDAGDLFYNRLDDPTLDRLSVSRQRAELLELLFPDGLDSLPRQRDPDSQAYILNALAITYSSSGQPRLAWPLLIRHNTIRKKEGDQKNLAIGLNNLTNALRESGELFKAHLAVQQALLIIREQEDFFNEAYTLSVLGRTLAVSGMINQAEMALRRASRIYLVRGKPRYAEWMDFYLSQLALWNTNAAIARPLAEKAWTAADLERNERDLIRASRLQGAVALALGDLSVADKYLNGALTNARTVYLIEIEPPALIGLAELRWRQGDLKAAREFLGDVWELTKRGPYPLFHADALNVLAQIERDEGNQAKAVEAATKAYRLSWCDGPPFAYHWGLEKARKHLAELGAEEPLMPPFDESKFEPMPEVEIDPEDEFHAGKTSDN